MGSCTSKTQKDPTIHNPRKICLVNKENDLRDLRGIRRNDTIKILLIGINYIGTVNELGGCINDVTDMRAFFIENYKVKDENIVMMHDRRLRSSKLYPTRANILSQTRKFVEGIRPGDLGIFHYSGHGTTVRDTSGDEKSGYDSAICPVDFDSNGFIVDDDIRRLLRPRSPSARMLAIFDACHSGTMMDNSFVLRLGAGDAVNTSAVVVNDSQNALGNLTDNPSNGIVACVSSCLDTETSQDGVFAGRGAGVLSFAFRNVLRQNPTGITWSHLLRALKTQVLTTSNQHVEITFSKPTDPLQEIFLPPISTIRITSRDMDREYISPESMTSAANSSCSKPLKPCTYSAYAVSSYLDSSFPICTLPLVCTTDADQCALCEYEYMKTVAPPTTLGIVRVAIQVAQCVAYDADMTGREKLYAAVRAVQHFINDMPLEDGERDELLKYATLLLTPVIQWQIHQITNTDITCE